MKRMIGQILIIMYILCGSATAQEMLINPILENGADPWIIKHEGVYYYCHTGGGGISVSSDTTIQGALRSEGALVWTPPAGTEYSHEIWAPELLHVQGRWYIHFAADDGNNRNHRMYVLEAQTDDPQGEYEFVGKITDKSDRWAIDGTVLEHQSRLYYIWSGWKGLVNFRQFIYIAEMSDPLTISSERVEISRPQYAWERLPELPWVNEGPEVLKHGDDVFIIYSASGSWSDYYCQGQLRLTGDDPLNPAAWTKTDRPVFSSSETAFGPGHVSFTKSPDDTEDWIIYHTARYQGSGWDRDVSMKKFTWDENGDPVFGQPEKGVEFPAPSEDYVVDEDEPVDESVEDSAEEEANSPLLYLPEDDDEICFISAACR